MNIGSSQKLQSTLVMATDGHTNNFSRTTNTPVQHGQLVRIEKGPLADVDQVVQRLKSNIAKDKEDAIEVQKVSEIVLGRKVQFNVNQEIGQVVVAIVDPQTNRVIKEIPSAEEQKLKAKIRRSTGHLFDVLV